MYIQSNEGDTVTKVCYQLQMYVYQGYTTSAVVLYLNTNISSFLYTISFLKYIFSDILDIN